MPVGQHGRQKYFGGFIKWLHIKKSLTQTLAHHLGLHTMGPAVTASSVIKRIMCKSSIKKQINMSDV